MVERTGDVAYITDVATHPRVWRWISEDGDKAEHYAPDLQRTIYLRTQDGYVSFRPFTKAVWEVHIALLPKPTRPDLQLAQAMAWMAERGVSKFLGKIVSQNRHAISLAKRLGFVECGRVRGACTRGGKPLDVVLMEF